jgi:hypothetical protein
MTGMLCWACGLEPIQSVEFEGAERVVRFRHNCPVLAMAKQRVLDARRAAAARAERMATMELLLREYNARASGAVEDLDLVTALQTFERNVRILIDAIDQEHEFQNRTYSAVIDADTCPACRETDGQRGKPVPHPACTNPNGCRCWALP